MVRVVRKDVINQKGTKLLNLTGGKVEKEGGKENKNRLILPFSERSILCIVTSEKRRRNKRDRSIENVSKTKKAHS